MRPAKNRTRSSTATRAPQLQRILETRRPRRVPFISRQSDSTRPRCVPPFEGDEGAAAPTHFGDATPRRVPFISRQFSSTRARRVPFISRQSDSTRPRCVPPFNGDEGVAAPMYFGDATSPSRSASGPALCARRFSTPAGPEALGVACSDQRSCFCKNVNARAVMRARWALLAAPPWPPSVFS